MSPQTQGPLVLVVEDEPQIRRFLRATLPYHGYRLIEASTGAEGLALAAERRPDLVILDLGLPDLDGLEVMRRIREWSPLPIIVLTAREGEEDKIEVLDAGADDYLTKPFGVGELMARMRVALRRSGGNREAGNGVLTVGDIQVDLVHRQVLRGPDQVHLTPVEYRLLVTLAKHPGKVLTHRQLLTEVWGPSYAEETHYLRVYMRQLRHKLEEEPANPRRLVTEPGVGYRFRAD